MSYIDAGDKQSINLRACCWVIRPEGITLQCLFNLSSAIELSCRWLSIAKGRRLIHTQKRVSGTLCRIWAGVGIVAELKPKTGAAIAVRIPKMVLGKIMVLISLYVNNQRE